MPPVPPVPEDSARDVDAAHDRDIDAARDGDPARGAFDPPHHPPLLDRATNPRGVRHIGETAQDHMPVSERPRVRAAARRRTRMVTAAMKRLRSVSGRRSDPDDPTAA